jgi:two-component system LytT family sensor kinase
VRVPSFLLHPIVENAIVHGFSRSRGPFRIEIRAAKADGKLTVEVANTGHWKPDAGEGIGLTNTRRRLELAYDGKASLVTEQAAGWVRVRIRLPLPGEAGA